MELYARQQFDFMLVTAVDRYVERIIQRNQGAENALRKLRQDAAGEGVWLDQFVTAIFQDFLLDNVAGACFILQALSAQKVPLSALGQAEHAKKTEKIETLLLTLAKAVFADLLQRKTEEFLEQQATLYGGNTVE